MKTIKQLAEAVAEGLKPVITFTKAIEDMEAYPEGNMRARIIGYQHDQFDADKMVKLTFDYSEFDQFNAALEQSNYYDKNGVACLTARQSGNYEPIETIWFMAGDEIVKWMTIETSEVSEIYDEFIIETNGKTISYVQWLEQQILKMRGV